MAFVRAGDPAAFERLPGAPGEFRQRFDMGSRDLAGGVMREKKPVAAPSDVSSNLPVAIDRNFNAGSVAIGRNVVHRHLASLVQDSLDRTHGGLQAMRTGADLAKVGERHGHSDGPVPAHAEQTDVVEENDARRIPWLERLAEKRPHDGIISPGLVNYSGPEMIVLLAKNRGAVGNGSGAKVWSARNNQTRGLAAGVRIDYMNPLKRGCHRIILRNDAAA